MDGSGSVFKEAGGGGGERGKCRYIKYAIKFLKRNCTQVSLYISDFYACTKVYWKSKDAVP